MKTVYCITYYGPTNKIETMEVEATGLEFHGEDQSAAACWTIGKRTVFAIPFRFLIQTVRVSRPKGFKDNPSKNSGLRLCS